MKFNDQKTIHAVLAYLDKGNTIREAAEKFGVNKISIYQWVGRMTERNVKINYKKGRVSKFDWDGIAKSLKK